LVKIILVRHGETALNQSRCIQGSRSDTQLNQKGKQQAESLALRLRQERIQAIYSSPLRRALDTAQAIARYHQIEVDVEPNLIEIDVGELEGVPVSKIGGFLDQLLSGQAETNFEVHGGESLAAVQQRAWSTIQRLIDRYPDGVLAVVCHYFVILTIICSVLGLPLSQIGRLRLGEGSISTIVSDKQAARLVLLNDTCHLVPETAITNPSYE